MPRRKATDSVPLLGYALLGMLARQPGTGYELSRRMTQTVSFYWTWRHSQVYGQLADLNDRQLIRYRTVDGAGPRETKRYSITPTGRHALTAWVATPAEPHQDRDPLLLRVHSLWTVDGEQARRLLEDTRAESVERLDVYRLISQEIEADGNAATWGHPDFSGYATVRAGIAFREGRIDWCDWLLAQIPDADRQEPGQATSR